MADFVIYYSSSCPFDNTADKVMRDLTHRYPEIRGRIECKTSDTNGVLEVKYKATLIFSKEMSRKDRDYSDLFDKIEMILDEESEQWPTLMNSQDIFDAFKRTLTIRKSEGERKTKSGSITLLFSGAIFSILGGSYLFKSGIFTTTQFYSLNEALRLVNNGVEEKGVPVLVSGKIHRIHGQNQYEYAILKKITELHSRVFDQTTKTWKDTVKTLESSITGTSFDLVTSSGQLVTVSIPEVIFPHNLILLNLKSFQRNELVGEEKKPYLLDIERAHFAENCPIDESVVTKEEGITLSQTVYVRGILSKRDDKYYVHSSGITTLTLSTRSIVEESENYRTRGVMLIAVGIGLLLGGLYRLQ